MNQSAIITIELHGKTYKAVIIRDPRADAATFAAEIADQTHAIVRSILGPFEEVTIR